MHEFLERCETCGEIMPETEVHYDEKTDMTWCESPTCGQ